MSAIKLNSSGGGSITISPASTASNLTLTAPAQTGTIGIQGPIFDAYSNTNQSLTSSTNTKLLFQLEEYDPNSVYNTSTSIFQPNVAGYYWVNASTRVSTSGTTYEQYIAIFKNGGTFLRGSNNALAYAGTGGSVYMLQVNSILYLNGSTDYVEIYAFQTSGNTQTTTGTGTYTRFQSFFVRPA